ncbi:MAG: hypothetical protein Q3997_09370 [Propionibacteriaceae bacterium]|nr:hypothetical protein [Propionibacteriaceae bacterium]
MTNPPRLVSFSRRQLLAGFGVASLLAAGCTAGDWREEAPPAAGVQATVGDVTLRNLILVVGDRGESVLMGSGVAASADTLVSVRLTPHDAAGNAAPARTYAAGVSFPAQALTPATVRFANADLKPGMVADLTLSFDKAGQQTLRVPSLASTHPDFAEAWTKAQSLQLAAEQR